MLTVRGLATVMAGRHWLLGCVAVELGTGHCSVIGLHETKTKWLRGREQLSSAFLFLLFFFSWLGFVFCFPLSFVLEFDRSDSFRPSSPNSRPREDG